MKQAHIKITLIRRMSTCLSSERYLVKSFIGAVVINVTDDEPRVGGVISDRRPTTVNVRPGDFISEERAVTLARHYTVTVLSDSNS